MSLKTKLVCTLTIILYSFYSKAVQQDTSTLFYQKFIQTVLQHHPIAQQALLKLELGQAQVLGAKGTLDPFISSILQEKDFDNTIYYRQQEANITIPTTLGLGIVGGYENNNGVYLNPENYTPANGIWHLGVELDVLQGLITNERNTAIRQAKEYQNLTENEKDILLNDLLFNASLAYLQWQLYYEFNAILNDNYAIAQTYFENTKSSYFGGEKTAMDTLEAYISLQDAMILRQKNEMELIKTKLYLENFLWYENTPISLKENTIPEKSTNNFFTGFKSWQDTSLAANNPNLKSYLNKLSILEIEQKLKREKLKPKLKLKYTPLISDYNNPVYLNQNFTWGIMFSMPIFLRQARADVKKGQIQIKETELDFAYKKNELENKIENTLNQQKILEQQVVQLNYNVNNYKELLDGETTKFKYGESSVFLINRRQEKYISARLKLVESQIQFKISKLTFLYYTNQLM